MVALQIANRITDKIVRFGTSCTDLLKRLGCFRIGSYLYVGSEAVEFKHVKQETDHSYNNTSLDGDCSLR